MADNPTGLNSITALIIPLSSSSAPPKPQPPGTGQPPTVDNTLPGDLPRPSHPIYYPLPPGAPVDPEYGIPSERPDNTLPPGVDNTLPGAQPRPEHPIVLPPDAGGGWGPIYIWGPGDPRPTVPIVIPPDGEAPPEAGKGKIKWKAVWTPSNGWQTIGVVVPEGPAPTPSKK